jgi:hypothetical protein
MFGEIMRKYTTENNKFRNNDSNEPEREYFKIVKKETKEEEAKRLSAAIITKNSIITPAGFEYDILSKEKL